MKIKTLKLKNFGCFQDFEIEFHPRCNVLSEMNGKSTTLAWEQRLVGENNAIQQFTDDVLLDYAKRIQNEQASCEFPFIAYYHDLGRMWLKQKRKGRKNRKKQFLNRLDGYG